MTVSVEPSDENQPLNIGDQKMATATIDRHYSALPWAGCTVYVFEFSASEASDTINLRDFGEAGTGIEEVRGILEFERSTGTAGSRDLLTASAADVADTVAGTGVVITINNSTTRTLVVIGR